MLLKFFIGTYLNNHDVHHPFVIVFACFIKHLLIKLYPEINLILQD